MAEPLPRSAGADGGGEWSEIRLRAVRRLPEAAFAVWALAVLVVVVERPGRLLELATIGIAGLLALLAGRSLGLFGASVALYAFAAPLLNTWPTQLYDRAVSKVGLPSSLFAVSTVLGVLVVISARRTAAAGSWRRLPPLLLAGLGLLLLGGFVGALHAADHGAALAAWWTTYAVPITVGLVVATRVRNGDEAWGILVAPLAASLVVIVVGLAAYVLEFGFPLSGADLVSNHLALYRPFLFQDVTLGNVAHVADLAVLLLPAALIAGMLGSDRLIRAVGACVSLGLGGIILVATTRAHIATALGVVLGALALGIALRRPRALALPALVLLALVVTVSTPDVRGYFRTLVPVHATHKPLPAAPGSGEAPAAPVTPGSKAPAAPVTPGSKAPAAPAAPVTPGSEAVRLSALRQSLDLFRERGPLGVGPGQYERYDPAYTAAHSLLLQLLVELGVLGAAGLVLAGLYVVAALWGAVWAIWRNRNDPGATARLACVTGAAAFLAQAFVAGSLLEVGRLNVWSMLLWLQVGLAAGLATRAARAHAR